MVFIFIITCVCLVTRSCGGGLEDDIDRIFQKRYNELSQPIKRNMRTLCKFRGITATMFTEGESYLIQCPIMHDYVLRALYDLVEGSYTVRWERETEDDVESVDPKLVKGTLLYLQPNASSIGTYLCTLHDNRGMCYQSVAHVIRRPKMQCVKHAHTTSDSNLWIYLAILAVLISLGVL
ncbi:m135R [Myxoma virus]|uniref:M135R n=1 Tax=Myxoma virus TaxID=10273 RepID=A0A481NMC5_9POXV|nr:m135R [Myxoma virus]QAV41546.1 m135R [Myxoma virus]QAV42898.1 m135R [Myxoma virus]